MDIEECVTLEKKHESGIGIDVSNNEWRIGRLKAMVEIENKVKKKLKKKTKDIEGWEKVERYGGGW